MHTLCFCINAIANGWLPQIDSYLLVIHMDQTHSFKNRFVASAYVPRSDSNDDVEMIIQDNKAYAEEPC